MSVHFSEKWCRFFIDIHMSIKNRHHFLYHFLHFLLQVVDAKSRGKNTMQGCARIASSSRNGPNETGEPVPNFAQVRGEAVLATSLSQSRQRGVRPAVAFPTPVVPGQLPQDTLRAAGGLVVLACCQLVAP